MLKFKGHFLGVETTAVDKVADKKGPQNTCDSNSSNELPPNKKVHKNDQGSDEYVYTL